MTWPHAKYHTATGLHKSMAHWPYNTPQWVRLRKVKSGTPASCFLTDYQPKIVMNAACLPPAEKRDSFLRRIPAMLALRGYGRFTVTDVADVAQLALAGLVQKTADAA